MKKVVTLFAICVIFAILSSGICASEHSDYEKWMSMCCEEFN